MSSKDIAVSVRGLSKSYTISHNASSHTTLSELIVNRVKKPVQRVEKETFWALKDVDFEIKKGEVVGVIGRNGAGKSTLLKILSQITEPTTGQIDLYGRVGSLLEVGSGFHPELTGRENIFLNGSILGMRRSEIERQFDAIVDFAEVENFIDTPVKRYSSGMYVRLAFAVAAHLNPEILIIDEVLAVGDAAFQKKCLGKMGEVSQQQGKTVLFVSHNMTAVQTLCSQGVLLKQGRVADAGNIDHVLNSYLREQKSPIVDLTQPEYDKNRVGDGQAKFTKVFIEDYEGKVAGEIAFGTPFALRGEVANLTRGKIDVSIAFAIAKAGGEIIFTSHHDDHNQIKSFGADVLNWRSFFKSNILKPGLYSVYLGITDANWNTLDYLPECIMFEVLSISDKQSAETLDRRPGLILPPMVDWIIKGSLC